MIHDVLDFMKTRLNQYLNLKFDSSGNGHTNYIQLANVAWNDTDNQNTPGNDSLAKAFITLVNIEEDRISRSPDNSVRQNNNTVIKNPKVYLNLYVLFSVNLLSYYESLKRLSYIIQFFQHQNVFTPLGTPVVPEV